MHLINNQVFNNTTKAVHFRSDVLPYLIKFYKKINSNLSYPHSTGPKMYSSILILRYTSYEKKFHNIYCFK